MDGTAKHVATHNGTLLPSSAQGASVRTSPFSTVLFLKICSFHLKPRNLFSDEADHKNTHFYDNKPLFLTKMCRYFEEEKIID